MLLRFPWQVSKAYLTVDAYLWWTIEPWQVWLVEPCILWTTAIITQQLMTSKEVLAFISNNLLYFGQFILEISVFYM